MRPVRAVCRARLLGAAGELHPSLRERLGLAGRAFAFELEVAPLGAAPRARYVEAPRYPGSTRDVSFFVAADLPFSYRREQTFYSRHGDWFGWSCVGLALAAIAMAWKR